MLAQAYRKAAESFYERIEKLNPDSYRAHQLEAESLAWRGQGQKAILEYRKALERKPDLEGAHRGIADLYWEQGALGRASKEYEAELRLFPLDDHSQLKVGEYWLAQGNGGRAIQAHPASHSNPKPPVIRNAARQPNRSANGVTISGVQFAFAVVSGFPSVSPSGIENCGRQNK